MRSRKSAAIRGIVLAIIAAAVIGLVVAGPKDGSSTAISASLADGDATSGPAPTAAAPSGILADPTPAPRFELVDFDDRTITNDTFRDKPLVLNFWASWCLPCRNEMPALNEVFDEFAGSVEFFGIAWRDQPGDARAFVDQVDVSYPVAMDANGVGDEFVIWGMPTTFFVDAQGEIVARVTGEFSKETLLAQIDVAFGDIG